MGVAAPTIDLSGAGLRGLKCKHDAPSGGHFGALVMRSFNEGMHLKPFLS